MPEISIKLENNTDQPQTIDLFQSKSRTSQTGKRFTFTTPYAATYVTGYYFRVKFDNVDRDMTISSTYTRQQIVDWLNTLSIGTWTIDSSVANNIFKCFSAFNILQELEIALSNRGIGRMIIESTFIVD